jgi:hypothetical protein
MLFAVSGRIGFWFGAVASGACHVVIPKRFDWV